MSANLIDSDTIATIGNQARINESNSGASGAQDVEVKAENTVDLVVDDGSLSGGAAALGGAVDIAAIRNDTLASVGDAVLINVNDALNVSSTSDKRIRSVVVGASGGAVTVAGSVGVYTVGGDLDSGGRLNTGSFQTYLNTQSQNTTGASLLAASQNSDVRRGGAAAQSGAANSGLGSGLTNASGAGTTAALGNGVDINGGGSISVTASDNVDLGHLVGTAGGSALGAGAGIGIVKNNTNVRTSIGNDADIHTGTGGDVNFAANRGVRVDDMAVAGSGSLTIGVEAAVALVDDLGNTTASIGNNLELDQAHNVTLSTSDTRDLSAANGGGGLSLGAAAGAEVARARILSGQSQATIGDNAAIGQSGIAGINDLTILAQSNMASEGISFAASGGLLAAGIGATSDAEIGSAGNRIKTAASLGTHAHVNALDDATIDAVSQSHADAQSRGTTISVGVSVGVPIADATAYHETRASVGNDSQITAGGDIRTAARHDSNTDGSQIGNTGSDAQSYTVSGAALLSIGVEAHANTLHDLIVSATDGDRSQLSAAGSIDLWSKGAARTSSHIESTDIALGVGIGITNAAAVSRVDNDSVVGASARLHAAGQIDVDAFSTEDARSDERTGAGAIGASVGIARGTTTVDDHTTVTVGESARLEADADTSVRAREAVFAESKSNAGSFGIAGGLNSDSATTYDSDVDVNIGANATVKGNDILLDASVDDLELRADAYSAVYAIVAGNYTRSNVDADAAADVNVAGGAQISTPGDLHIRSTVGTVNADGTADNFYMFSKAKAELYALTIDPVPGADAYNTLRAHGDLLVAGGAVLTGGAIVLDALSPGRQGVGSTGKTMESIGSSCCGNFLAGFTDDGEAHESFTSRDTLTMNGTIQQDGGGGPRLVIGATGVVRAADLATVTFYRPDGSVIGSADGPNAVCQVAGAACAEARVVTDPFPGLANVTLRAANGDVAGNGTFVYKTSYTDFEITNEANLTLTISSIGNLNLEGLPPVTGNNRPSSLIVIGHDISNFTNRFEGANPNATIQHLGRGDIVFATSFRNTFGDATINARNGNIYMSSPDSSIVGARSLVVTAPQGLIGFKAGDALPGDPGTGAHRLHLELEKFADLNNQTSNPTLRVSALGDVDIDVTAQQELVFAANLGCVSSGNCLNGSETIAGATLQDVRSLSGKIFIDVDKGTIVGLKDVDGGKTTFQTLTNRPVSYDVIKVLTADNISLKGASGTTYNILGTLKSGSPTDDDNVIVNLDAGGAVTTGDLYVNAVLSNLDTLHLNNLINKGGEVKINAAYSGNGKIRVLSGYRDIDIDNASRKDIVLHDVDWTTAGAGSVRALNGSTLVSYGNGQTLANSSVGVETFGSPAATIAVDTTHSSSDVVFAGNIRHPNGSIAVNTTGAISGANTTYLLAPKSATLNAAKGIGSSGAPIRLDLAGGNLNAGSSGDIYIDELNGDLNLGFVNASGRTVRLRAQDSIYDDGDDTPDVTATTIILVAGNGGTGSIGRSSKDLDIDSAAGVTLTAASGDVFAYERAGDLNLQTVTANGTARLKAAGAIVDASYDDAADVVAPTVDLTTLGGDIGSSANLISIDASSGVNLSSSGSIYLQQLTNDLRLNQAQAATNVLLSAPRSILDAQDDAAADVIGQTITLTTGSGSAGLSTNDLDVNASSAVNVDAATGVFLEQVSGDLKAARIAARDGNVTLTAQNSIVESVADASADILGKSVSLTAAAGSIGGSGKIDIDSTVDATLFASGNITVEETSGDLNLKSATSTSGNVKLTSQLSILDAEDDAAADVTAQRIELVARSTGTPFLGNLVAGSIGTPGNRLEIDSSTSAKLTAGGQINVQETAGDLNIEVVQSTYGGVSLVAAGSIVDWENDAAADVVALTPNAAIVLTATAGSIGTLGGSPNDLDLDSAGPVNLTAGNGVVSVEEVVGDLALNGVTATGDVQLVAAHSILDGDTSSGNTDITGAFINLIATNGSIGDGESLRFVRIDSSSLTALGHDDVLLDESAGNLNLNVAESLTGNLTLKASNGSILDNQNDAAADVRSARVTTLTAGGTIGTPSNDLEIDQIQITGSPFRPSVTLIAPSGIWIRSVANAADPQSTGNIYLSRALATADGTILGAITGNVSLIAAGSITDADNDAQADVIGGDVTLQAGVDIGDANFLEVMQSNATTLIAGQDIFVERIGTAANPHFQIKSVTAGRDIHLIAAASFLDANTSGSGPIITGKDVVLNAGTVPSVTGGAGTPDKPIRIDSDSLTVTATDLVNIHEVAGDLNLKSVENTADVILVADVGSIVDLRRDNQLDVKGRRVTLTAASGSIGEILSSTGGMLEISAAAVDATARGDIGLVSLVGSLGIGSVVSTTGDVHIEATEDGAITDADNDSATDIRARYIYLFAFDDQIGSAGKSLDVDAATAVMLVSKSGINVAETAGDLNLIIADGGSAHGNVTLKAPGSIVDGYSPAINLGGGVTGGAGVRNGGHVSLTASGGRIGSGPATPFLVTSLSADFSASGDIDVFHGDLQTTAAEDLNLSFATSTSGDIRLVSEGSILEAGNDAAADVTANVITLRASAFAATASVGSAGNALEIDSRSPVTITAPNGVWIGETAGDLTIASIVTGGDVGVTSAGAILDLGTPALDIQGAAVSLDAQGGRLKAEIDSTAARLLGNGNVDVVELSGDLNLLQARSSNGSITVLADGSIVDAENDSAADVVATSGDVTLTSSTGSIGTADNALEMDSGSAVTLVANGLINVAETNGPLNLNLAQSNSSIRLSAAGAILDNQNDPAVDVRAGSTGGDVVLVAGGAIGTPSSALEIDSISLTANAGATIDITEAAGDLNAKLISAGGTVTLVAAGSILDADSDAAADVVGSTLNLTASAGSIGTQAKDLDVDSTASVTFTAPGDIRVHETAGSLLVASASSATGDVVLSAAQSILESPDDSAADVIGHDVVLIASGGTIGTAGSPFEIAADSASLSAASDVNIADLSGDLSLTQGTSTSGNVSIDVRAGNLRLGQVHADTGLVTLRASAGIFDTDQNPDVDISARALSLTTLGDSIGLYATPLSVELVKSSGVNPTLTLASPTNAYLDLAIVERLGAAPGAGYTITGATINDVTVGGDVRFNIGPNRVEVQGVPAAANARLSIAGHIYAPDGFVSLLGDTSTSYFVTGSIESGSGKDINATVTIDSAGVVSATLPVYADTGTAVRIDVDASSTKAGRVSITGADSGVLTGSGLIKVQGGDGLLHVVNNSTKKIILGDVDLDTLIEGGIVRINGVDQEPFPKTVGGVSLQRFGGRIGVIDVTSNGVADVELFGGIFNSHGPTSINVLHGSITSGSPGHVISGKTLTLAAPAGTLGTTIRELRMVAGDGGLTATAQGDIILNQLQGDLYLARAQSSGGGDVRLTLAGSVFDAEDDAAADVVGDDITITARGSIGALTNDLDIDSNTLTLAALRDIAIEETAGDANITSLGAAMGDVVVVAPGSILEVGDDATVDVSGNRVELHALGGSIGSAVNTLEIDSSRVNLTAHGVINVSELAGSLSVEQVSSATGAVTLVAADSILDAERDAAADVVGTSVVLSALTGSVGSAEEALEVDSTTALTVTAAASINLEETAGDLNLKIASSLNGDVTLKAAGSIVDVDNDVADDVVGRRVELTATAGSLGSSANAIEIDSGRLMAGARNSIYIRESDGPLNLEAATSATGDVVLTAVAGPIVDVDGDTEADAAGALVSLTSLNGSIGSLNEPLEIDSTSAYLAATADIVVHETAGNLNLLSATSASGDVVLVSPQSILHAGAGTVDVSGKKITLTALNGSVGSTANALGIDSNGVVRVSAQGDIYASEVAGDLVLDSALSAVGNVGLFAAGAIVDDANDDATDIVGSTVQLRAQAGTVGTATSRTAANSLDVDSNGLTLSAAGDINVEEVAGNLNLANAATTNGSVWLRSRDASIVVGDIAAPVGLVTLTAADSIVDRGGSTTPDITSAGARLTAANGSVGAMGDPLVLQLLRQGTNPTLNADAAVDLYVDLGVVQQAAVLPSGLGQIDGVDIGNVHVGNNARIDVRPGTVTTGTASAVAGSLINITGDFIARGSIVLGGDPNTTFNVTGYMLSGVPGDVTLTIGADGTIDASHPFFTRTADGVVIDVPTVTSRAGHIEIDGMASDALHGTGLIEVVDGRGRVHITNDSDLELTIDGIRLSAPINGAILVNGVDQGPLPDDHRPAVMYHGVRLQGQGSALGEILVYSNSLGNVWVAGGLYNPLGFTEIRTAAGSVLAEDDTHLIEANILSLSSAGGSLGAKAAPLLIDVRQGTLVATAVGDIILSDVVNDLNVGRVESLSGDVWLSAAGSILDAEDDPDIDVRGRDVRLTATAGSVGTAVNDLDIDSTGALTIAANGDVNVSDLGGDVNVASVVSAAGNVTLVSAGAILEAGDDAAPDVVGHNVELRAQNGAIGSATGSPANALEIDSQLASLYSTSSITVEETSGDLNLLAVQNGDADVTLSADGSILDAGADTATDIQGRHVTLVSFNGSVGAPGAPLQIDSTEATLRAAGDIRIEEIVGDLNLNVADSAGGDITIAAAGAVLDNEHDPQADVIGNHAITLTAGAGIGTSSDALDLDSGTATTLTAVDSIYASDVGGDLRIETAVSSGRQTVRLSAAGSLVEAGSDAAADVVGSLIDLTAFGGTIGDLGGSNALEVDSDRVILSATGDINIVETVGDLNVKSATSSGGDVRLWAPGSIVDIDNENLADVIGQHVELTAAGGTVGTHANPFEIDSTSATVQAQAEVVLTETAGDLNVDSIRSQTNQDVSLIADGSILDHDAAQSDTVTDPDVAGGRVDLLAQHGGIGTPSNPLEIDSNSVILSGIDYVHVAEVAGDMNLLTATSRDSSVALRVLNGSARLGRVFAANGTGIVEASDSILDANADDLADLTAHDLDLTAHSGSIGVSGNPIETETAAGGLINAFALDNVYLTELTDDLSPDSITAQRGIADLKALHGHIQVGRVEAGTAIVLDAWGGIFDRLADEAADLVSGTVSLTALGLVGAPAQDLDIAAAGDLHVVSGLGVNLRQTDGDLHIADIDAKSQDVKVRADKGDVYLNWIRSQGHDVTVSASGSIFDANGDPGVGDPNVNVDAETVRFIADTGSVGAAGNLLEIETAQHHPSAVSASAATGVYLEEMSWDLNLGTIRSGSGRIVLVSPQSIVDALAGDAANITGADVSLIARGGSIGYATAPLRLDTTGTVSLQSPGYASILELAGNLNAGTIDVGRAGTLIVKVIDGGFNANSILARDVTLAAAGDSHIVAIAANRFDATVNLEGAGLTTDAFNTIGSKFAVWLKADKIKLNGLQPNPEIRGATLSLLGNDGGMADSVEVSGVLARRVKISNLSARTAMVDIESPTPAEPGYVRVKKLILVDGGTFLSDKWQAVLGAGTADPMRLTLAPARVQLRSLPGRTLVVTPRTRAVPRSRRLAL